MRSSRVMFSRRCLVATSISISSAVLSGWRPAWGVALSSMTSVVAVVWLSGVAMSCSSLSVFHLFVSTSRTIARALTIVPLGKARKVWSEFQDRPAKLPTRHFASSLCLILCGTHHTTESPTSCIRCAGGGGGACKRSYPVRLSSPE